MHSRKVKFEFPLTQIQVPVVSSLVKEFDVAPNILSANISPLSGGWLIVELIGDEQQIERAVKWTVGHGITVTDYVSPAA